MTDRPSRVHTRRVALCYQRGVRWWAALVAALTLAGAVSVGAQEQGGAGFIEGEDIGGGEKFAVYGAERWFNNHALEWRAKAAGCKTHLEAARAEENAALALRPAMLAPGSHRDLLEQFHAHIAKRTEYLKAFADCSNEANRYRPEDADRPAYYYGRPDPPVDFAQGVAQGVTDGFKGDAIWYAASPGLGPLLQKFKKVGTAVAAVGAASTANNMLKTAQEVNPNVDPYDFGRKVGELIYQGADLKDAVKNAAKGAASLPAAGARAGTASGAAPASSRSTGASGSSATPSGSAAGSSAGAGSAGPVAGGGGAAGGSPPRGGPPAGGGANNSGGSGGGGSRPPAGDPGSDGTPGGGRSQPGGQATPGSAPADTTVASGDRTLPSGNAGAGDGGGPVAANPAQPPYVQEPGTGPTVPSEDVPTLPRDPSAGPSARGPPAGKKIAEGGSGTVYEYPGDPTLATKKLDRGTLTPGERVESVGGQQHGADLIAAANANPAKPGGDSPAIPMTKIIETFPDADPPALVMENINAGAWRAKGAYVVPGKEPFADEELAAANELADTLADNGLVWTDPNRGNVFFFFEGDKLRAGILDHDYIYTPDELKAVLRSPQQSLGLSVFGGKWQGDPSTNAGVAAVQDWYSDFMVDGVIEPHAYMDAMMRRHGWR
jgi:ribosomal protein L12E/L44/L45/RPP1/RPP2